MGRPKGKPNGKTIEERFWDFVEKIPNGCWLWTGALTKNGYGTMGSYHPNGKRTSLCVHRVSYEIHTGAIKEGYEIDHLCHTKNCSKTLRDCLHRRCVNPDHLNQVTPAENMDRSNNYGKWKTHCIHGHEYTEENTRWHRGWRACKICIKEAGRRNYYSSKEIKLDKTQKFIEDKQIISWNPPERFNEPT